CPYWGCAPSKTLLRSGDMLTKADRARLLAASSVEWAVDFPKVSTRVLWMARHLDDSRPAAAMEVAGARLFRGEGTLTDPRTLVVGSEQLGAHRALVIANGSTAGDPERACAGDQAWHSARGARRRHPSVSGVQSRTWGQSWCACGEGR